MRWLIELVRGVITCSHVVDGELNQCLFRWSFFNARCIQPWVFPFFCARFDYIPGLRNGGVHFWGFIGLLFCRWLGGCQPALSGVLHTIWRLTGWFVFHVSTKLLYAPRITFCQRPLVTGRVTLPLCFEVRLRIREPSSSKKSVQ